MNLQIEANNRKIKVLQEKNNSIIAEFETKKKVKEVKEYINTVKRHMRSMYSKDIVIDPVNTSGVVSAFFFLTLVKKATVKHISLAMKLDINVLTYKIAKFRTKYQKMSIPTEEEIYSSSADGVKNKVRKLCSEGYTVSQIVSITQIRSVKIRYLVKEYYDEYKEVRFTKKYGTDYLITETKKTELRAEILDKVKEGFTLLEIAVLYNIEYHCIKYITGQIYRSYRTKRNERKANNKL